MSEKMLGCGKGKEYCFSMNIRQGFVKRLEKAWGDFLESFGGLSEAEMLKPGVIGRWSVRDIIAHVTTWEEEALKYVPVLLQGGKPPRYSTTYGGIDAFNAQMTERKRGLSFSEVLRERDEVHRKLIDLIDTIPDELLGGKSRLRHRIRMDTYSHYPKHAGAIRKWRNKMTNYELAHTAILG